MFLLIRRERHVIPMILINSIIDKAGLMNTKNFLLFFAFALLTLSMTGLVAAQEDQQVKAAAPTTPPVNTMASIAANKVISVNQRKESLLKTLNLKRFDDIDDEACAADENCVVIKRVHCIASACEPTGNKNPTACFKDFKGDARVRDELICKTAVSPDSQNRKELLAVLEDNNEGDLIPGVALIQAVKGNSATCQDLVKKFVGPYGNGWNKDWYVVMSGCRILAKERTIKEEDDDYATWADVDAGNKTCSEIINVEMFNACSAKGAASPFSSKDKK